MCVWTVEEAGGARAGAAVPAALVCIWLWLCWYVAMPVARMLCLLVVGCTASERMLLWLRVLFIVVHLAPGTLSLAWENKREMLTPKLIDLSKSCQGVHFVHSAPVGVRNDMRLGAQSTSL